MNKKTAGQIIQEVSSSNTLDDAHQEYRKVMFRDFEEKIHECAINAKDQDLYKNKDFYVVVLFKVDRLLHNSVTPYFFARRSCPTPVYNQIVFKYHTNSGQLQYLWNIPNEQLYHYILANRVEASVDNRQLLQFCLALEDGSLLNFVKKENGEKKDGIIYNNAEVAASVDSNKKQIIA
jgi:hypothetical protein